MSEVLGVFVRALFCFQRKTARQLGVRKPFPGAVAFLQRFGSALQLTPHVHLLAPDGVFEQDDRDSPVRLCLLPPPDEAEVEELLRKVALCVVALMREEGKLEQARHGEEALAFLRRLAALVPPPGVHLVRCFGVRAPSARLGRWWSPVPHPSHRSRPRRHAPPACRGPSC